MYVCFQAKDKKPWNAMLRAQMEPEGSWQLPNTFPIQQVIEHSRPGLISTSKLPIQATTASIVLDVQQKLFGMPI